MKYTSDFRPKQEGTDYEPKRDAAALHAGRLKEKGCSLSVRTENVSIPEKFLEPGKGA